MTMALPRAARLISMWWIAHGSMALYFCASGVEECVIYSNQGTRTQRSAWPSPQCVRACVCIRRDCRIDWHDVSILRCSCFPSFAPHSAGDLRTLSIACRPLTRHIEGSGGGRCPGAHQRDRAVYHDDPRS
jgi:hypothetical protein